MSDKRTAKLHFAQLVSGMVSDWFVLKPATLLQYLLRMALTDELFPANPEMPAVAMTDHGNLYGDPDLVLHPRHLNQHAN